jgi:hypothetical protein
MPKTLVVYIFSQLYLSTKIVCLISVNSLAFCSCLAGTVLQAEKLREE